MTQPEPLTRDDYLRGGLVQLAVIPWIPLVYTIAVRMTPAWLKLPDKSNENGALFTSAILFGAVFAIAGISNLLRSIGAPPESSP